MKTVFIKGYEGMYTISDTGVVTSLPRWVNNHTGRLLTKKKVLKPNVLAKGYLQVELKGSKDGKRHCFQVHRLVAEAFIPNPNNLPQVNHINGNKQDNRVENLEWTDNSGNQLHAWRTGLQTHHKNQWKNRKGVAVAELDSNGNIIKTWEHIRQAELDIAGYAGGLKGAILRNGLFHKRRFIII